MFRNADYVPTKLLKFMAYSNVACLIGMNLTQPEFTHVLGHLRAFRTAVPEAPVYEHGYASSGEYKVRTSRQGPSCQLAIAYVREIPKSLAPQRGRQSSLGTGAATIVSHRLLTLTRRHHVTRDHRYIHLIHVSEEEVTVPEVPELDSRNPGVLASYHTVQSATSYEKCHHRSQ